MLFEEKCVKVAIKKCVLQVGQNCVVCTKDFVAKAGKCVAVTTKVEGCYLYNLKEGVEECLVCESGAIDKMIMIVIGNPVDSYKITSEDYTIVRGTAKPTCKKYGGCTSWYKEGCLSYNEL